MRAGTKQPLLDDSVSLSFWPAMLVFVAVFFNSVLAVINGHVVALNPSYVIAAEILLVGAAHLISLANYRREMAPWYGLIGLIVLVAVYRSMFTETAEVKFLRDVLLIPTFVILGLTFDLRRLTVLVLAIHALVLAGLILEALSTDAYASLFKVQDYYINTRGHLAESFWNKESDLYVSATRPDQRLFSFVDLHRLSSIFLEPVSLGNYCIVITIFVCTRFAQLGSFARWFLIGGNLLAIIGCDGRLAAVSSLLIVLSTTYVHRLPRYTAVLYLPASAGVAFLVVWLAGYEPGPDNFSGRVAHTIDLLKRYDVAEYAGVSDAYLSSAVDSGLAYLITTQSLLGVIALWLFITMGSPERTVAQQRFTHGAALFLSLTLLVSFAFLSIKIAALLWFIFGVLNPARNATQDRGSGAPSRRRLPPKLANVAEA